jgi:hypothetical protein
VKKLRFGKNFSSIFDTSLQGEFDFNRLLSALPNLAVTSSETDSLNASTAIPAILAIANCQNVCSNGV